MSTLTKSKIEERLKDKERPLVISPILDLKQIGDVSVDLRLGNQFIVFRMHRFGEFSPYDQPGSKLGGLQERQVIRYYGEHFVLHPGVLVLGSTFEYIGMPNDLEGQIEGRSSWARLGLQIATASSVEPGFGGVLTLELSNVGTIPLKLHPGVRVAQLVLHDALPQMAKAYKGKRKYLCPVGPQFSRAHLDDDGKRFSLALDPSVDGIAADD